jgi:hypothetical protein
MSATNIINSTGDRKPPWGTPDSNFTGFDVFVSVFTYWVLSMRNDLNHLLVFAQNP